MASSGDSNQRSAQPTFNTLQFGTMSDSQLRQTISQLSHAASGAQYQAYAAPTPQRTSGRAIPPFSFSLLTKPQCSLPEKYRKLVHIFNSSATHLLTTQPSSKKQQSCPYTRSCTRHALARTHPTTRLSTNNTNSNGRPTGACTDGPTRRPSTRPTPDDPTSPPIDLRLASPNRRDAPHAAHPLRHVHSRRNHDSNGHLDAPATRWRRQLCGPRFRRRYTRCRGGRLGRIGFRSERRDAHGYSRGARRRFYAARRQ